MSSFFRFIASPAGRFIRILAGLGLIVWGLVGLGEDTGLSIAVIGVVPLLTGLFDICLFAPLLGHPLRGTRVRTAKS